MQAPRAILACTGRCRRWLTTLTALLLTLLAACGSLTSANEGPVVAELSQLGDTFVTQQPYVVWATVQPGLAPLKQVTLRWKRSTDATESVVEMKTLGGASGAYLGAQVLQGAIPAQPAGTNLLYAVQADDEAGKRARFPAAEGLPRQLAVRGTGG